MSVIEILKDISDHVVKSTQEALKQKMKLLVNNVLSEEEVIKKIKSGIECGIQKNIIPKKTVDLLGAAEYNIDYATWTRLIGTNKEEFEKIIKKMKEEKEKQPSSGGMRKTRVSRKKKTKKKKRRTRKLKKRKKQSGGNEDSVAKALTQLANPMSVISKSMETYTDAHAKPPTDIAREFSEGVLALVREAVNSVRQQTINSFQHIASEGHEKTGSFQNTLKTKIEQRIRDEVYPDYVINQNGLQNVNLDKGKQEKFSELLISKQLIHKAYAQTKPNVKGAIDKYWNKFNSQRAKNKPKDNASNPNGINSNDFDNNFKSQLETPLTQLDDFIDANKYNKNAETSLMEYAKEIKDKDSQKDKLLDSLKEKYQSYKLYDSYKKTKKLGSTDKYQEPNMNEFIRYGNQNMGKGDAFELLKELHKFSTSKNAIESGNRKREEMRKNNQKPVVADTETETETETVPIDSNIKGDDLSINYEDTGDSIKKSKFDDHFRKQVVELFDDHYKAFQSSNNKNLDNYIKTSVNYKFDNKIPGRKYNNLVNKLIKNPNNFFNTFKDKQCNAEICNGDDLIEKFIKHNNNNNSNNSNIEFNLLKHVHDFSKNRKYKYNSEGDIMDTFVNAYTKDQKLRKDVNNAGLSLAKAAMQNPKATAKLYQVAKDMEK